LQAYNNSAQAYDNKFSSYNVYINKIKKFALKLPRGSRILDMGCGSGVNAALMEEQGHTVTGVDLSDSMLEIARRRCPGQTFIQSSVLSLITSPDKYDLKIPFDGLCLSFLIVHLNDDECHNLLNNLNTFLADNGLLYLSFMPLTPGKCAGLETTSFSDEKIYFHYHDSAAIVRILEEKGFSLQSRASELYKEKDGSETEDLFLIFKYRKQGA